MAIAHHDLGVEQASSSVASEPLLLPFLTDPFDPAEFFNQALPNWSSSTSRGSSSDSLYDISMTAQTLLSQLNTQLSRLSNNLTLLTDEIPRSGGRLAYEVEILKSDVQGLSDSLTVGLREDIQRLGIDTTVTTANEKLAKEEVKVKSEGEGEGGVKQISTESPNGNNHRLPEESEGSKQAERLRSLTIVRDRLEEVIKIFGLAIEWPIPPSEVSLKSSFISVSAPEPGAESQSREAKGREWADRTRQQMNELLNDSAQSEDAFEVALNRIEALSDLATVWKGTSEEKARIKFVESLVKLVNDRRKSGTNGHQSRTSQLAGSIPRKYA